MTEEKERVQKMDEFQKLIPTDVLSFTLFEQGQPADAIVKVCHQKDIDLIVMTTRGRKGMSRILEGSTTEDVVRAATCPVFVLHQNTKIPVAQPSS